MMILICAFALMVLYYMNKGSADNITLEDVLHKLMDPILESIAQKIGK